MRINEIVAAGDTTIDTVLATPDGGARRLVIDIESTPDGIVSLRAPRELRQLLGADIRPEKTILEAVHVFRHAAGLPAGTASSTPRATLTARLHRIAAVADDTYELDFADDPRRFQVTVAPDGELMSGVAELGLVGDLAALKRAVAALHHARGGRDGTAPAMSPQARTVSEAGAYLELILPDRDIDWRREVRVISTETERRVRFEGPYKGRSRYVIDVAVTGADQQPALSKYVSYGSGRSALLDAGQWLLLERFHGLGAHELVRMLGAHAPDDSQYNDVLRSLRLAAGAAQELAKFVPEGSDAVSDDGFWTPESRAMRASAPAEFQRDRIESSVTADRNRLDEWVATFGPGAG